VKAVLVVETLIVAHAAADHVLAKVAAHRRVREALARVRIAVVQAVSRATADPVMESHAVASQGAVVRIVGGKFRGRALVTPATNAIRPTTDRTRESLFNILAHSFPDKVDGGRVLDLFAGTGALGLEALSRGSRYAVFVEESAEGRGILRQNIEAFGLQGQTKVLRRDACKLGEAGTMEPFDLIFADPPYGRRMGEKALLSALEGSWLNPDALIVLEEEAEASLELDERFVVHEERNYGGTIIRLIQLKAHPEKV
jgi:16S rRNA (guanine(966)-N(2))-methyltransferase RsmD